MDNSNTTIARVSKDDIDEVLTKVRRYAMAASLAALGLRHNGGVAGDDGYESIEELTWDITNVADRLQCRLRAEWEADRADRRIA